MAAMEAMAVMEAMAAMKAMAAMPTMPRRYKMELFDLYKKLSHGDIVAAHYILTHMKKNLLMVHENVLIIFEAIGNCIRNEWTPQKIALRDLCNILEYLGEVTKTMPCFLDYRYFTVFLPILQFVLSEDGLTDIPKLNTLLTPPLISFESPKLSDLHQKLVQQIYDSFLRKCTSDDSDKSYLIEVLHTIFLMCNHRKNLDLFINSAVSFVNSKYDYNILMPYYSSWLKMVEERQSDCNLFNQLMKWFSATFSSLLKNLEFDAAIACYDETLKTLKILYRTERFSCLLRILEICKWFVPGHQEGFKNLETLIPILDNAYMTGCKTNLLSVGNAILSVTFVVPRYYKINPLKWVNSVSERKQLDIFMFMDNFAQILSECQSHCDDKTKCDPSKIHSCKILPPIILLGHFLIRYGERPSYLYKAEFLNYVKKTLQYVAVFECSCVKWENYLWIMKAIRCNHEVLFSNNGEKEKKYLESIVRSTFAFPKQDPFNAEPNVDRLASRIVKMYNFERSLAYTAVALSYSYQNMECRQHYISMWINTKLRSRTNTGKDDLLYITLTKILDRFQQELIEDYPDFNMTNEKRADLLELEIRAYKERFSSFPHTPMIYIESFQLMDVCRASNLFIKTWTLLQPECQDLVPEFAIGLIKKVTTILNTQLPSTKLLLAQLYLIHHMASWPIIIRDTHRPIRSETEIAKAPLNNYAHKESFTAMNLSQYPDLIKSLTSSFELVKVIGVQFTRKPQMVNNPIDFLNLLEQLGYYYRLHGNSVNYLHVWEIALNVAKIAVEPAFILKSIGFIIEVSDVNNDNIKMLVGLADGIATKLSFDDNFEVLVTYHLSKASAYLYVDFDFANRSFEIVYNIRERLEEYTVLKIKLLVLHQKIIMLPCNLKTHEEPTWIKIHQAFKLAYNHYKKVTHCDQLSQHLTKRELQLSIKLNLTEYKAYHLSLIGYPQEHAQRTIINIERDQRFARRTCCFFDVGEEVIRLYHSLRQPRKVLEYIPKLLELSRYLMLPFRALTFFSYFSLANMHHRCYSICHDIMLVLSDVMTVPTEDLQIEQKYPINFIINKLLGGQQIQPICRQYAPEGTKYQIQRFKVPQFVNHADSCICTLCSSAESYYFFLKQTYVNGLLNFHIGDLGYAREYYLSGINLYKIYEFKRDVIAKKLCKNGEFYYLPTFERKNFEIYAHLLLEIGNILLKYNNLEDAKVVNTELLDCLRPVKSSYLYLHKEALTQKLNIIAMC